MKARRKLMACAIAVSTAVVPVAMASSAQAAGSGYDYFYTSAKAYKYYGSDRQSGSTIIATTSVPGFTCSMYVRSVQTTIRLPNGASTSSSSLIGQCSNSAQLNLRGYSIFQAKTTHQVTLWSGVTYSFTD